MQTDNRAPAPPPAGGVRVMRARWVVTGTVTLETAAAIGGAAEDDAVDMPVLRDATDGAPLLPGTTLAGALRAHLADVLDGFFAEEPSAVAALFGAARADDAGGQSPLLVFDARGCLPGGTTEIRDGVALDPAAGTAAAHKKFDFEVLPPGTRFPVRVELVVGDLKEEPRLVGLLARALAGLAPGEIALGARRSRGLGAVRSGDWRARRHELADENGWLEWLRSDHEKPIAESTDSFPCPMAACRAAWPAAEEIAAIPDKQRRRTVVDAALVFRNALLVRSRPAEPDAPDAVHLASGGKPVLPGTGLAGTLRARALRIARLVRDGKNDAERWVDELFGPALPARGASGAKAAAARLRVSESTLDGGQEMRPARIRIDRFTQGVVKGALFEEQPLYGGQAKVRLELRNPEPGEEGLLLLLLRDLLSGDLVSGGAGAVGRGVAAGRASVRFADGRKVEIGDCLEVCPEGKKILKDRIREFHECQNRVTRNREAS